MVAEALGPQAVHRVGHGQRLGSAEPVAAADHVVQDQYLDLVEAEPAEACLDAGAHLAGQVAGGRVEAVLGRDARTLAGRPARQPAPDHGFRDAVAVHGCGVDPVDPRTPGPVEGGVRDVLGAMDEHAANPAPAKGDGRDLQFGSAEAVVFHGSSSTCRRG